MGAELTGKTAAQQYITREVAAISFRVVSEVIRFAEDLCGEAARNAPVDKGDLRGSFVVVINGERWMHTDKDGNVIRDRTDVPDQITSLEIYVGTAGCVYALRQHEEITWQHPKGGQAKYMEYAYNQLMGALHQRLNDAKNGGD